MKTIIILFLIFICYSCTYYYKFTPNQLKSSYKGLSTINGASIQKGDTVFVKTKFAYNSEFTAKVTNVSNVGFSFVKVSNDGKVTNKGGWISIRDIIELKHSNNLERNTVDKLKVDVFFMGEPIIKPFIVKSIYQWRFSGLGYFYKIEKKSIKKHIDNCIKEGGDAVIIQADLVNSFVINYTDK